MEDKKVGELWKYWTNPAAVGLSVRTVRQMCNLIVKLIEERAQNHFWSMGKGKQINDFYKLACSDYDIPFPEYQAAKEGR